MRTVHCGLVAIATIGLVAIVSNARADEEKIPLDKVPQAVVDAVKQRFPQAELKGAEKEVENGKTEYEVAINNNGQKIEVATTPEGTIIEIEKQIASADMPKAVADALDGKYPGATYKTIEEVVKVNDGKEKLEYYEVLVVTAQKKKYEVNVSPEGKVLKEEDKNKSKD